MKRAELRHAIEHASSVWVEFRSGPDTESTIAVTKTAALEAIDGALAESEFFARESGTTVILGADTRRKD